MENDKYLDIICLPCPKSKTHAHMSTGDRAVQFAPFAALSGYGDEIKEAARLTDKKPELDEEMIAEIDLKLRLINENIKDAPKVTVEYFIPDGKKEGGRIEYIRGKVKIADGYRQTLIMADGLKIPFSSILDIKSSLFALYDN